MLPPILPPDDGNGDDNDDGDVVVSTPTPEKSAEGMAVRTALLRGF